ncbi:MAG: hypothetical protein WC529_00055 [Candidatus Margulisiibacteriota bacterium]
MENLKTKIVSLLETCHVGKRNAITFKAFARQIGVEDRRCRELVAEIVTSGACPIISSSDREHGGYYVAGSPADGEAAFHEGYHRIKSLQQRITGLKLGMERHFGQEKMDFAEAVR